MQVFGQWINAQKNWPVPRTGQSALSGHSRFPLMKIRERPVSVLRPASTQSGITCHDKSPAAADPHRSGEIPTGAGSALQ